VVAWFDLLRVETMKKPLLILTAALCVATVSGQAEAFCGDAVQGCSQAFTNGAANPQNGTTSAQGFDAQTGRQWSSDTTRFGNFTLRSGFSQGDSWNNPQSRFGDRFNNAAGLNSQSQSSDEYCALYGTCKPMH
jgi:hypothetical protein